MSTLCWIMLALVIYFGLASRTKDAEDAPEALDAEDCPEAIDAEDYLEGKD
jgi:hypothetical protein